MLSSRNRIMKKYSLLIALPIFLVSGLTACSQSSSEKQTIDNFDISKYSQADFDYLAIKEPTKLSAASKRALERGYHKMQNGLAGFIHKSYQGILL